MVSGSEMMRVPVEVADELRRVQAELKAREGVTVSLAEILRAKVLARPEPERAP